MSTLGRIARFFEVKRWWLLYLCYALPMGLYLCVATPPFQTPDAVNHFYRALQVADGHAIGDRVGVASGGAIDPGVVELARIVDPLRFHAEVKYDEAMRASSETLRWTGRQEMAAFPNTAIYPAYAYLPQALAIRLGKGIGVSLVSTYRLACVLDLFIGIGLICWALVLCRRLAPLIFTVALLPMSMVLLSSVSQEASMLPACLIVIAWLDRRRHDGHSIGLREGAAIAAALVFSISCRPPYAALLLIFFFASLRFASSRERYGVVSRIVWCFVTAAVAIGVVELFAHTTWMPVTPPRSVSGQLEYLLRSPIDVVHIGINTMRQNGAFYYYSLVGVLGWLDTWLGHGYYVVAGVAIGLAFVCVASQDTQPAPRQATDAALACLILLLSGAMIFGSLYLSWTPVGQGVVDGVQGRYFLGLLPLAGLLVPAIRRQSGRGSEVRARSVQIAHLFVAVFPIYSILEIVRVISFRFYG
ncbi:putative membrane protein DUF2142 [Paraburkholderia unamae]|uniref:DUF2142 domain-containing protein n=1 Tax=Paraburkholderia unamae TaxID=219649 RepID=UPI000DC4EF13|nr:DUF2142 domain-containing protein [Paraburkholderia unamae]RAR60623.1 putative membrane protein DUF2142 [Paraburkholderia unamae]